MVYGLSRWALVLLREPAGVSQDSCRPISCSVAGEGLLVWPIFLGCGVGGVGSVYIFGSR